MEDPWIEKIAGFTFHSSFIVPLMPDADSLHSKPQNKEHTKDETLASQTVPEPTGLKKGFFK